MKKQELLDIVHEASISEESATALYLKHLDAFCTRFDIDKKYIDEIKEKIQILIEGNKEHKRICEETYKKVSEDERDDF